MEKEVNPEVIKATQTSLGKYVKKPPLTEKLLKKPPFRFLHDIITSVIKTTGFFNGLYDENELISENVKDRESKILFLSKTLSVLVTTTGKPLSAKPSKIVAGQEPEKTNELLQLIAEALDRNLSSNDAVQKYKEGISSTKEKKPKDQPKPTKKIDGSKSKENDKPSRKRETLQNDKNSSTKSKTVKSDKNDTDKKVSPPKIRDTQQKHSKTNNGKTEKRPAEISSKDKDKPGINVTEGKINTSEPKSTENLNNHHQLNNSYTIDNNDINSTSSSSVDLIANNAKTKDDDNNLPLNNTKNENVQFYKSMDDLNTEDNSIKKPTSATNNLENNLNVKEEPIPKPLEGDSINKVEGIVETSSAVTKIIRPQSVRPSSSRPGAPRLKEKNEHILAPADNTLLAKVNIISENAPVDEEDESETVVFVEEPQNNFQTGNIDLTNNQHGHLVQQILESQKEFAKTGKTEIEWEIQLENTRETANQEIESLRFNIQALSRVANPLGRLLDHVQEDVEVMRQEVQKWKQSHEEASKELAKQKLTNEESLHPSIAKSKQLDIDIQEKREKICDLKVAIHKNTSRIEKLLMNGRVQ